MRSGSRVINKPGDAVLSDDGTAKVNRKHAGFWTDGFDPETGKSSYFFSLARGEPPVVKEYYRHVFREKIGNYVVANGIELTPVPAKPKADGPLTEHELAKKERKARGASYSHITRGIRSGKPLTGKSLELALEIFTPSEARPGDKNYELCLAISKKLEAGQPLSPEEAYHADMILLHSRLG